MKLLKRLTALLIGLQVCSFTVKGFDNYNFEQITVEDGLSSNNVRHVCRDYLGYIWIVTAEGLQKYDGNTMRTYFHDNRSNNNLPSNRIRFICEDDSLNIWIGTSHSLARYNRMRDNFETMTFQNLSGEVHSFCEHYNRLIFGYNSGIVIYNLEQQSFKEVLFDNDSLNSRRLLSFDEQHLLINTNSGNLLKYHLKNNSFSSFAENNSSINSLIKDDTEQIWVGRHNGLLCYDQVGQVTHKAVISENAELESGIILDIVKKGDEIWISTDGAGIFIYNKVTNALNQLYHSFGVVDALPANSIKDLFVDDFGNVLASSVRAGVIWINEGFIQSFSAAVPGGNYGLINPTVLAFYEDVNKKIWIGTDGGGVNVYDPESNSFSHIEEYNTGKVVSICGWGTDRLLMSFYNDKVRVFNLKTNTFESNPSYEFIEQIDNEALFYPIILRNDDLGNVWKLGGQKMIIKPDGSYDLLTEEYGWNGQITGAMFALKDINNNELIVGGSQKAYHVNTNTKVITEILSLNDDKWEGSKLDKHIYSIEKVGNKMWLASSVGLFSFDIQSKSVSIHPNSLFRAALSVAKGSDSSLWIGAGNGLFRFFPDEGNYQLYGRSEGVKRSEFINRAALTASSGDVYLGAVNGFVKINPQVHKNVPVEEAMVNFDNIMINGVAVNNDTEIAYRDGKINLDWDNTSLRINLIVREKNFFRKRIYRILLDGNSDEVVETTSSELSFTHLPSGKYNLKVWCNRIDGSWPDEYTSLAINVVFPWWKKWWFFASLVLVIMLLVYLIKYYLTKQSELTVELELERERKEHSKQLNEQKLEFFTNISHELRTPLSLIYGPLKRLVEENGSPGSNVEQINLMYRQAGKMKRLVDQVLDIRKMEAGKQEILLSTIDIGHWLVDFFKQFELEFESKYIEFKSIIPTGLQLEIDTDKLDKILSNLISNAIKYSPEGGCIFFELKLKKSLLLFTVCDEGPGVKEEDKEKLFDRFFQSSDHKAGSGVGLAFVHSLVQMLGGHICVKNKPNGGALFEFELPKKISANTNVELVNSVIHSDNKSDTHELDYSQLKDKTVMVVEDDNDLRKFIVEGLLSYTKVIEAVNGLEAWYLLNSKLPDIVVSDVMMPKMDGFRLCQKVKEDVNVSHIPILLLTARSDGESRLLGYKVGADAYLSKPFSLDILLVRLTNIFTNREVQKELFKDGTVHALIAVTNSNADEVFLRKVVAIINDNMEDPQFDVSRLNAEVAMSRSAFYSKIKAITGLGVNEFIKQLKINKACELLKNTSMTIGEVAAQIGYDNQRYFSTVFKELKELTPSQYRQVEK